jgi:hypothetical protein
VYSSEVIQGLAISVTHWRISESNSIQRLFAQIIVNNENLFPGAVTRENCGVPPCPISQVNSTYVNFGNIDVSGLDYQLTYRGFTSLGEFVPSIQATQTYRYKAAFLPGTSPVDRTSIANDDGNWAPRWRATAALGWSLGSYSATFDGRYVGRYQDYDSTNHVIGNFWICDANFRFRIGQAIAPNNAWIKGTYVEVGGVNIFNTLPQFSNYFFDTTGYDAAQADIRGRFLYVKFGGKW